MLFAALRRRWPILTTVAAGLLWLLNNYQIRGLDGLRLEPKPPGSVGNDPFASAPLGFPTSFPSGPTLPSSSPTPLWPNTNSSLANNLGVPAAAPMLPSTSPAGNMAPGNIAPGNMAPGNIAPGMPGTGQGVGYQAGYPGQALPPVGGSVAGAGQFPNSLQLPSGFNVDQLRPAAKALGPEFEHLLSVGEKLGMLESSRQPAPPTSMTSVPTTGTVQPAPLGAAAAQRTSSRTLRVASFNLSGWGDTTRDNLAATELIVRMLGQFDVVALQDIRSRRDDLLPNLVERMNSTGRQYDFMIGPRIGRGDRTSQLAFVFDTASIETDRFQLYTVADPEDMLSHEPLVGWFRSKRADEREAFTFSLVNMHIDKDLAGNELSALPNLVEAIYGDGRGEDDVILAGDFCSAGQLEPVLPSRTFRLAIEGVATTTRGNLLADNIVFPHTATAEFTGRAGVVDFLRQFNLSLEQAVSVSEHLPVWAEFSIIEGGRPGQVAGNAYSERN